MGRKKSEKVCSNDICSGNHYFCDHPGLYYRGISDRRAGVCLFYIAQIYPPYKTELLILLLGGGFLGLSGLLNTMITIIRFQNSLLAGYGIIAAAALFFVRLFRTVLGNVLEPLFYIQCLWLLFVYFFVVFFCRRNR